MGFDMEGITKGATIFTVLSALMTFANQLLPTEFSSFFDLTALPLVGGIFSAIGITTAGMLVWGTVFVILSMMAADRIVDRLGL